MTSLESREATMLRSEKLVLLLLDTSAAIMLEFAKLLLGSNDSMRKLN